MAKDVLSQTEIDNLITALSVGEITDEVQEDSLLEYRPYDFRRPSKFSKEQMRTLQVLHENYARMLGNFLSAYLRVPVQIRLSSVSQVTYEEFVFSLPIPTLVTVFNMSPEMGTAMLETNPAFVFPLIDIVFGGKGQLLEQSRELTDIEITVMKKLNSKLLDNLRYVWEDLADLSPEVETMDTNPQFNQMFASTETVALLTFNTFIKDNEGMINLCFPFITLEKIMPKLTTQYWFKQAHQDLSQSNARLVLNQLENVDVELSVILGNTTIALDDFLYFEEGDIIQLPRMEGDDFDVYIEGEHLFYGQPGANGQNMAVQITGRVSKEEKGYGR
ncbi:MAG: flagellar motor switch protein FliM [Dethiobacteria bacterium]